MKKVRIKDIAEKAGVSIGTVDRVLHNRGEVKAATRELVTRIAKEMDYQPNLVARALTAKQQFKLAALLPQARDENVFWSKHPEGINQAIKQLEAFRVGVDFYYFELQNEAEFNRMAQELLAQQPDGVILAPILRKESAALCEQLDQLAIPYVFIDTFIDHTHCLSFIGEDAYQSGRVAASLIDYGLEVDKDILIVNLTKDIENTLHLTERNQGFQSYFLDAGRNEGLRISVEIPSTNRDVVNEKMDRILKNNANIGAILVSSAKTHVIARYLEKHKIYHITLIGYEVTTKNLLYMKRGGIKFLIGQRPVEQGEKAVLKLYAYLSANAIPEKKEFQSIDILNAENIDMYH